MSEQTHLRELVCRVAASLFARGLTHGATGNISVRTTDGDLLVTPTGASLGTLDPGRLALVDAKGRLLSGDPPTKEMSLHDALYETRAEKAQAVIHLHSTHSVAVSMLPETDPHDVLPAMTPYAIMRLGKVALLPYFRPGDAGIGAAIRGLAGKRSAILLANHGPVVAGGDIEAAAFAIEELEETARLALLLRGMRPRLLTAEQIHDLAVHYPLEWN